MEGKDNAGHEKKARNRFILFMVIGSAGILLASLLKMGDMPPLLTYLIAIGVPGISIFLYGWQTHQDNKVYARTAGFADSLYYMGFLLTMVALVAALIGYAALTDGEESIIHSLQKSIPEFGTAIISTILGMVGRIYLVGFRNEPEEIKQMTMETLDDAMSNMVMHANSFAAQMQQASATWQQTVANLAQQAQSSLQGAIQVAAATINAEASTLGEALRGMTASVTGSNQSMAASLDEVAAKGNAVGEACDKLAETSGKLSEVIRELAEVDTQRAGEATRTYIENLENFTGKFEAVARRNEESAETIARAGEAASKARTDMIDINVEPLQNELSRAQRTVREIADDAERAQEQIPKWTPWRGEFWKNRFGKGK